MKPLIAATVGLGAVGAIADWKVMLGAAIGSFIASVVGATISKSDVKRLVMEGMAAHERACINHHPGVGTGTRPPVPASAFVETVK